MILKGTLLTIMACQFLNVPYRWGGDNYDGMDCSGFTLRSLKEVGIELPDMSSQSIYHWAKTKEGFYSCEPGEDCLLFFGPSVHKITHIAIGIGNLKEDTPYMIEAGGAGKNSLTMDLKDLARIDARVRFKPVSNRKDLIAAIKIKY